MNLYVSQGLRMHQYERAPPFTYTYISSLAYTKEVNEK